MVSLFPGNVLRASLTPLPQASINFYFYSYKFIPEKIEGIYSMHQASINLKCMQKFGHLTSQHNKFAYNNHAQKMKSHAVRISQSKKEEDKKICTRIKHERRSAEQMHRSL